MNPLTIDEQIERQIQKGCTSEKETIRQFLKTSSYYTINYSYEKYIISPNSKTSFLIKDYKWLEETNEKISRDALSIILRSERIIRNRLADRYSLYCKDNAVDFFSKESLFVDSSDYPEDTTSEDKDDRKDIFIDECWKVYTKKKSKLDDKYKYSKIKDVPPFVIAQHLTFGQVRVFYKLLSKSLKEDLAKSFNLRISEFNSLIEKLNFLRNACAHGEFILDYRTQICKKIASKKYHKYAYNAKFSKNPNHISFIPLLSLCSYFLDDNIKFFVSTMRNILEIACYNKKGSLNNNLLLRKLGLRDTAKNVQASFK